MKKYLLIWFFAAVISAAMAVNAPRQIVLFCSSTDFSGVPETVIPIVERAMLEGFDTETNFADMESRLECEMYLKDPILTVEFFVLASRILGLEREVIEKYPLMSPTFEDVKTKLERSYTDEGYDFSRNFGYVEYVQEYFEEKYGHPLLENVDPLQPMTKLQVIKGIVRLFSAISGEKGLKVGMEGETLDEWAEDLSKRLTAESGIDLKDVGYLTVFEKVFLIWDGEKYVSLLKIPVFSGAELHPEQPAPKWWTIALMYYIFGGDVEVVKDDELIPVRFPQNVIAYVPKKVVDYNPVKLVLKPFGKLKVRSINFESGKYPVMLIEGDKGSVVVLDNSKIKQRVTYMEKSGNRMVENDTIGSDFVGNYASLPDKTVYDERSCTIDVRMEKMDGKLKLIGITGANGDCTGDMLSKVPKEVDIEDLGRDVKILVKEIEVGTVKEIYEIINNYSMLEDKVKKVDEMKLTDMLPHMLVDIKVNVTRKSIERELTKEDFQNSTIEYLTVRDRLNLEPSLASVGSLKKFVGTFGKPYELVSTLDKPDFVDYWMEVQKSVSNLGATDDALISSYVIFNVEKDISRPYDYDISFESEPVVLWKFFVGKIISHEPATKRIRTEKFIDPLEYYDDTWIYVEFKDGKIVKNKRLVEEPNIFYNDNGVLRNMMLWFQLVKEDGKVKIKYIIAKEF